MEKKGIKESKELLKAMGVLAATAGAVYKDKKVDVTDFQHLVGVGMQFQTIMDGFNGFAEMKEELSDLDAAEMKELFSAMLDAAAEYEKARTA